MRISPVVFSFVVMVIDTLPAFPLAGVTTHQSLPELTVAVHAVLAVNDTVKAPPFSGTTGAVSVPDANVILSGLGSGAGVSGVVFSLSQQIARSANKNILSNLFIADIFLVFLIH